MINYLLKHAGRILDRRQKTGLVLLLFVITVGSFLEMVGVSAILPLVSLVTDPGLIGEGIYAKLAEITGAKSARELIPVLAAGMIIVYLIKNSYIIFMYRMQYRYAYDNQRIISGRLMEGYMNESYLFHTRHGVGELHRNLREDVENFFALVLNLTQLFSESVTCIFLFAFLMVQDVYTTLMVMALMLVSVFLVFNVFRKKLVVLGGRSRDATVKINQSIIHAFEGIKEIKASDRERFFFESYDKAYRERVSAMGKQMIMQISPRPIMETVMVCGLLAFISLRIYLGGNIIGFIPTISVFAVATIRMLPSFNRISSNVGVILYNKASVEALYDDILAMEGDGTTVLSAKKASGDTVRERMSFDTAIRLKNVSFYYPGREDAKVIDDISIDIKKNSSVAFIGTTGSGKTTLADIIIGLLPPVSGHVCADGEDVYGNLRGWHEIIGYIPQDIYILDGTIRENVAFGMRSDEVTDDEIWAALDSAQAGDFVRKLPDGLLSSVGPGGVQLSGGQRQRIGVARAMLRNPEIMILDEATSALDNDTESAVMDAIDALSGSKTLIIIAHRLSTIKNCDEIFEIKNGKAVPRQLKE
ncbi:MAG: ABC transporter ATP-binding protein/permease [Lachnospiraceae bacterium]|nr:ABC transporter ATP-binding protein/permease [Lachnospiraceae bacterium]